MGKKSNTEKYILEKLDNNARKQTWEMKLEREKMFQQKI